MGRPAFVRFLNEEPGDLERGVTWNGARATWRDLVDAGRRRAACVRRQHAYLVDPTRGLDAIAAFFAVATVPDTVLVWAAPSTLDLPRTELAPALYGIAMPTDEPIERPLWGVCTSGSSGASKVAVGHADGLELVALQYDRAIYQPTFPGGAPRTIATCLPLQFSAAFFMTLLPSLYLCRDLVVFAPHDWRPVTDLAASGDLVLLGVPALTAAAALGMAEPVDMSRAAFFLGAGHLSAQRVRTIRGAFTGVALANLYGTAETGAIAVDRDPGHNEHVGFPVPGKSVWINRPDSDGVGAVAVAGPDCCTHLWRPGEPPQPNRSFVASTDYGHFDADGHLCLDGRMDGGEKLFGITIYPRAVERHLLRLDGVADARVRVDRDGEGLEHLSATVVGTVSEADVRAHCASLADTERPSRIECIPETEAVAAYSAHGKL
ncbi:MAG TPA: AMP-binding protein [Pseudonocardiaceae bacterium]|jgi:acyl-coenzyme A synthetase/AMP-(fatty) acid ligase|nr:AMP-binding protein [Pseudonocardiaceae bacterium]